MKPTACAEQLAVCPPIAIQWSKAFHIFRDGYRSGKAGEPQQDLPQSGNHDSSMAPVAICSGSLQVDILARVLMPPGIESLRSMLHATAVEVLLYLTPSHCHDMLTSLIGSMNATYTKFMRRNPGFKVGRSRPEPSHWLQTSISCVLDPVECGCILQACASSRWFFFVCCKHALKQSQMRSPESATCNAQASILQHPVCMLWTGCTTMLRAA